MFETRLMLYLTANPKQPLDRKSPIQVSPPRLTLILSVSACDVRDAADAIPIPLPITMCPWKERKAVHAIGP